MLHEHQVCTPAINILEDMGVLKELVDNNEAHFADSGGFVSPSGLAYIGVYARRFMPFMPAACPARSTQPCNIVLRVCYQQYV